MATGHSREALNTLDYVITKQGAPATLHVQVRFFCKRRARACGGQWGWLGYNSLANDSDVLLVVVYGECARISGI